MSVVAAAVIGSAVIGYSSSKNAANAQSQSSEALAASSVESAKIAQEIADADRAQAKEQYDKNMAVSQPVIDAQLAQMNANTAQGQDYYDYAKNTFRPVEQGLVADAQNYGTEAKYDQLATQAAADYGRASTNQREQSARAMAAMGVNPNSGRFQSASRQDDLALAAGRANAMTGARATADNTAWARKMDVTGLGRNLPSASTAAYGAATNAGNSAVNNQLNTGNTLTAANNAANGVLMQGRSLLQNGQASVLNSATGLANSAYNNQASMFGTIAGAGINYLAGGK